HRRAEPVERVSRGTRRTDAIETARRVRETFRVVHAHARVARVASAAAARSRGWGIGNRKEQATARPALTTPDSRFPIPELYEPIHLALLSGLPPTVARKDEQGAY